MAKVRLTESQLRKIIRKEIALLREEIEMEMSAGSVEANEEDVEEEINNHNPKEPLPRGFFKQPIPGVNTWGDYKRYIELGDKVWRETH